MNNCCFVRVLAAACLLSVTASSQAVEQQREIGLAQTDGLYLSAGLQYETGDYGTASTTKLWQLPVGLDYLKGRISAGISTALLYAKSNGVIITSGGMGGRMSSITSSKSTVASATGIGDVNLYASYRLATPDEAEINYYLTGRVKLGTADANKGLGTGENDYAIEGGVVTRFQSLFVFGYLGYQITGDSATVNYDNIWYAKAGATYPVNASRSVGAKLEASQATTPGFDSPAQLTLFFNQALSRQQRLYFYVLLGLSNGSPDSGIGANLTIKI